MPRTHRGSAVAAPWRLAGVALSCSLFITGAPAPAATPPPGNGAQSDGNPRQIKSTGARRMSLGGTRSKAARDVKGLGQAKMPIKSPPKMGPRAKFQLGGVRSKAAPRISGLNRANVPDFHASAASSSAPASSSSSLTPQTLRATILSGARSRSDAFSQAVLQSGVGGDVDVGPRIRIRRGDPRAQTSEGLRALREVLSRAAISPAATGALITSIIPADGAGALDLARREFGAMGYTEIELAPGDIGFVRSDSPETIEKLRAMAPGIRSAADHVEHAYDWERRRACNSRDDDPCRPPHNYVVTHAGEEVDPMIVYGVLHPPVDSAPQPGFDAAVAAIEDGRYTEAASELRSYLNHNPEDLEVVRLLGIVQLLGGQTGLGIDTIGLAYEMQPFLASRPVPSDLLLQHPGDLRRALTSVVGQAHRTPSARAWLAAAVLMDAEGRPDQAVKMLQRATAEGLDTAVASEVMLALRP